MPPTTPTARELHAACIRGDEQAWALIFRRCTQLGERAGLRDAARDIAQDVVEELLKGKIRTVRDPDAFNAFVFRMMKNAIVENVRRNRHAELDPALLEDDGSLDASPEEAVMSSEKRQIIGQVLRDLEPRCRTVLRLMSTGHKHREIAALLGIPTNTVSIRIWRCIRKIRAHPLFQRLRADWSEEASAHGC